MHRTTMIAAALLLLLNGCGGSPRIDASSDAALDASVKAIASSLTEEQAKVFAADCLTLTMPAAMGAAFQAAFRKGKQAAPGRTQIFAPLQGMSAAEVHLAAEQARVGLRARAEEQAVLNRQEDERRAKREAAEKDELAAHRDREAAERARQAEERARRAEADEASRRERAEILRKALEATRPAPAVEQVATAPGPDRPVEVPPVSAVQAETPLTAEMRADIYKAAKSAVSEARNKAARRDIGVRKRAIEMGTEAAKNSVARRFGIGREQLDRIMAEGGPAAKKK